MQGGKICFEGLSSSSLLLQILDKLRMNKSWITAVDPITELSSNVIGDFFSKSFSSDSFRFTGQEGYHTISLFFLHAHTHTHTHRLMNILTHTYTHKYSHAHLHSLHTFIHTVTHIRANTSFDHGVILTHSHTHIHLHSYTHIYSHTPTLHIHTYIHIDSQSHTCGQIHQHLLLSFWLWDHTHSHTHSGSHS